MTHRLRATFSREGRLARLGPSLVLALGLFAYRPLFLETFGLPTRHEVESWFFVPDQRSGLVVIGVAGWLLWRKRARLLALPARSHGATTAVLAAVGTSLFVWAQLTGRVDLLIPSLASNLLALAGAIRGRAGCRAILVPVLVLLLAVPIPTPIRGELVWQLQLWTARGAAWVMHTLGDDVSLEGVLIQSGERAFTVIDSCSGLRGIEILTLVALVIRDLFAASGRRQWFLVLVAPWLAFGLNILRVAVVVVTTPLPQVPGQPAEDHTPQGLALLLAGTAVLYGLGWGMAATRPQHIGMEVSDGPRFRPPALGLPLRAAALWLVCLATASVTVTPLLAAPTPGRPPMEFPEKLLGWQGEDLTPDWIFLGSVQPGRVLYRRYEKPQRKRPPQQVELFVGFENAGDDPSSRLLTSMMALPGRDWSLDEARRARIWVLERDAELALVSRGSEYALVYMWRLRDEGIWLETARSLLALEFGPFRREPQRALIRLTTPLPDDGPLAQDRGKKTLDRFITDFRRELADL